MKTKKNYWLFALEMLNLWNTFAFLVLGIMTIFKGWIFGIIFVFISIFYMFVSSKVIYDNWYNKRTVSKDFKHHD